MTETEMETAADISALRFAVVQLGRMFFLKTGISPEHAEMLHQNAAAKFREETFPGLDPAASDHFAALLEERVVEIFRAISQEVQQAHKSLQERSQ